MSAGRYSFAFRNLCGVAYKSGNVLFSPDGNSLLCPVGNRITVCDLVAHVSYTLDAEARADITRIALSPDGRLLLAIDVGAWEWGGGCSCPVRALALALALPCSRARGGRRPRSPSTRPAPPRRRRRPCRGDQLSAPRHRAPL